VYVYFEVQAVLRLYDHLPFTCLFSISWKALRETKSANL